MIAVLLAAFPILLILALMLGWHWNSARAGVAGWLAGLIIAGLAFGANAPLLAWAHVRATFLAGTVLFIIWGALLFYRVTEAAGAVQAMSEVLTRISPHRAFQALLLAWGFASFLQSVGGYGVPVAVVAPLLAGIGFPPLASFVMASVGHTWAISFGSLGASFKTLQGVTNVPSAELALWSALLLGVLCLITGAASLWIAGGKTALRQGGAPMLLMGIAMAGGQWLTVRAGEYEIAAMIGALAGLLVGVGWAILQKRPTHPAHSGVLLRKALLPYLLLLILIFAARVEGIKAGLEIVPPLVEPEHPALTTSSGWTVPDVQENRISLLSHTGALLLYASLLTWLYGRRRGEIAKGQGRQVWRKVTRSALTPTLSIVAMMTLATTMEYAGMIDLLARGLARAAGGLFPLVSPFIGALGAFITGSNTNANALFGTLQRDTALALKLAAPLILAAQTVGGAMGSTFAPAKVALGCSTVGLEAQESDAMRALLKYQLLALGVIAALTFGLSRLTLLIAP